MPVSILVRRLTCQRPSRPPRGRSEFDRGRQAANHRGEVSLGPDPEQSIERFIKAVEIHLAAGQQSLQEVDPALLEVLRDWRLGLGWEPVVVHGSRLSPARAPPSNTGFRDLQPW
jgi:hypothetical protein